MAKTPEQLAWDNFKGAVRGRLNCYRVENQIAEAMPDVVGQNKNGATFWLELKAINIWPKRASTPVLRGKFEPGQIPWAVQWNQWGGNAFILAKISSVYYLLQPELNMDLVPGSDFERLIIAHGHAGNIVSYLESLT